MEELVAKVGLFIEWLKHEKDIKYAEIAKRAGIKSKSVISEHPAHMGPEAALKVAMAYRAYIEEFDRYYGWSKWYENRTHDHQGSNPGANQKRGGEYGHRGR